MKKPKLSFGVLLLALLPYSASILLPTSSLAESEMYAQLDVRETKIIYVDPHKGNDRNNGATQESSLKTITQALKIAESGTTIKLAWGEYTSETGEKFPLVIKKDVALQGSSGSRGHNIIIRGNGYFISPTGAGQHVAIAATREARKIAGITIINSHSRGHGLWVESANPQIASNTFTRNGNTGLSVNGSSNPVIEDNLFYKNAGNGLLVYGTSQPEVKDNFFEQTGFGVSIVQNSAPILTGNNFADNRIGIIVEGNGSAVLRDNVIENSEEYGLTAIAEARVDLGTVDLPGNNVFRDNGKLDIQNATNSEIPALGTEIDGKTAGNINFAGGNSIAVAVNKDAPKPIAPLLPPKAERENIPPTAPAPVVNNSSAAEELVFNAPTPSQPVPYPPETKSEDALPSPPETTSIERTPLNVNRNSISSLSDLLSSNNNAGVRYKVLVEVTSDRDRDAVRDIYPGAFATQYRGRSAMQVGAFSNWNKAKETWRSLEDLGLRSYLLE